MLTKEVGDVCHRDHGHGCLKVFGIGIAAMAIFLAGAQMGRATTEHQKYDSLIERENSMIREYQYLNDRMVQNWPTIPRYVGSNALTNTMLSAQVSGSGSQTVYAVFNGNMTIGNAAGDSHTINGDLTVNGELHVRPDSIHEVLRVVK